jgi:hypothetical protein
MTWGGGRDFKTSSRTFGVMSDGREDNTAAARFQFSSANCLAESLRCTIMLGGIGGRLDVVMMVTIDSTRLFLWERLDAAFSEDVRGIAQFKLRFMRVRLMLATEARHCSLQSLPRKRESELYVLQSPTPQVLV